MAPSISERPPHPYYNASLGLKARACFHKGECSTNATPRALVGKALRQGFYWPTALLDTQEIVRRCDPCQRFAKMSQIPTTAL